MATTRNYWIMQMSIRQALAGLRLLLILAIVPFWLLAAGMLNRAIVESDWGLGGAFPAAVNGASNSPDKNLANSSVRRPAIGLTVDLWSHSPAAQANRMERLREDGFRWVRQRVDWATIEPQPGQFNWQTLDQIISAITQAGLDPVILLDNSPLWAREEKDRGPTPPRFAPPANPALMASFASALASRYSDAVRYYQIWDEPNIAPHWGNRHIEPVEYARLLRAVGNAIRDADPDAVILTAALAPTADQGHTAVNEAYFLNRLYAATRQMPYVDSVQPTPTRPLFDAVAVQPFGFGYTPDHPRRHWSVLNFQRVAHLRRVMVDADDHGTPIWAMRFGWSRLDLAGELAEAESDQAPHYGWPAVDPKSQAAFAQRAVELARTDWPWLTHMGWPVDQPASPDDPLRGFALTPLLAQGLTGVPSTADSGSGLGRTANVAPTDPSIGARMLLLAAAAIGLGCRGAAAWRVLPWSRWCRAYRRMPRWLHVGLLAGLVVITYLAVWPPLLLACYVGAMLLFLAHPRHGVVLAVMLLPFHFQHKEIGIVDWRFTLGPAHAVLLCLLPALVAGRGASGSAFPRGAWERDQPRAWERGKAGLGWTDWLAVVWLVGGLVGYWNSWHLGEYVDGVVELVVMPLLLYLCVRMWAHRDQRFFGRLCVAFVASGVLVAAVGLVQWLQGLGTEADGLRRLVGPHFSPNHTALYLVRTVFVGAGLLLGWRVRSYFLSRYLNGVGLGGLAVGIGTMLVVLLLTASRGALLLGIPAGIAILGLAWSLRGSWGGRIWSRWPLVLVALGLLACFVAVGALFWERLTNSATIVRRFHIWQASFALWRDFPLAGVGPGGFFWRYPAYVLEMPVLDPNLRHPHNLWLELGTMMGACGLLWLMGFGAWLWRALSRAMKQADTQWVRLGLLASLAAAMAHGQVDSFAGLADLAMANWLALGILAAQVE